MRESDFDEFAQMLDAVYSLHNKSLSSVAKTLFFNAMADFLLADFRRALNAHVRDPHRGQFPPKPADLIAQLDASMAADDRPGAEEAWALALTSRHEAATVVWTIETAQAFAICRPVLETGDEVGARMAFKDAYNRLVLAARRSGQLPQWQASLGWDMAILKRAVQLQRLPAAAAAALLPAPQQDDGYNPDKARQNLQRIRSLMATMASPLERARRAQEAAAAEARLDMAGRKAAIAQQVNEYAASHA